MASIAWDPKWDHDVCDVALLALLFAVALVIVLLVLPPHHSFTLTLNAAYITSLQEHWLSHWLSPYHLVSR